jgi:hypothetical protein
METVVKLINKCPCLIDLIARGFKNSNSLSPFLINSSILNQLTSLRLFECIFDSKSLGFWSSSCFNLTTLCISFLNTSNVIDSDIEILFITCKKLVSFETNFPVKSEILNIIANNNQNMRKLVFHSNEFFPLDLFENFMSKMKFLTDFSFVVDDIFGVLSCSYDEKSAFYRLDGYRAFHLYSNTDIVLFQQYLALFSVPVQCQIIQCSFISMNSKMLNKLANSNCQFKELRIHNCNIPTVIDSLREVFQKCKQLTIFEYYDARNLMTADHLQIYHV